MTRGARLALVLVVAALACDKEPSGPQPGPLRVKLTSPAANSGTDGAMVFTLSGPATPADLAPGNGLRVFTNGLGATSGLVVTGTLFNAGTLVSFTVPDVRQVAQYHATIRQIATTSFALRDTTGAGYGIRVTR